MQHSYSAPMLATRPKQPSPLSPMSNSRRGSSFNSLDAVPEDHPSHGRSRHRTSPQPTHMPKGKSRMPEQPITPPSAQWVLDLIQSQNGRDRWLERSRVILVLGDVTPDLLAPILYNPIFEHTLLLVATPRPILSIEALISRKTKSSDIYPTLKPFSLKSCEGSSQHALPALLDHAVDQSRAFRAKTRKLGIGRRSESFGPNTPPLSPPIRPSQHRTNSHTSLSDSSDSDRRPTSAFSRPGSGYRRESFFGLSKAADGTVPQRSSSSTIPFDAVLNFIPSSTETSPKAALQQLLHQAVLNTTGVFPILSRKSDKGSDDDLPITLLHVVQSGCPGPLPSVIESFLLNFTKSFPRGDRAVWAAVAPPSVWLSPSVSHEGEDVSGAEVVLMGGVRCPIINGGKEHAWLGGWSKCLPMPGLLSAPPSAARTRLSQLDNRITLQIPPTAHLRDSQISPGGYSDYSNLSPAERNPNHSWSAFPTPPSTSGHSSPIPELDGSQSSASSTASLDAVAANDHGWQKSGNFRITNVPVDDRLRPSEYAMKPVTVVEEKKEKKGGWWKRKTSAALKA